MADTYVIHATTVQGGHEVVYAGPSADRAAQEMQDAAKTGRYRRFDFQWWDCGDVDGTSYLGDGRPEP